MRTYALLLALFASAGTALADLADEVRCREIGFSLSVEQQDHELFASFIDPDARFVGTRVDRGRKAISAAWGVFFEGELPAIKWRPQYVEVLDSGDLALSRGPYRIISKNEEGDTKEAWGTFNSVWRRSADGEWLVVFDAGSAPDETPSQEQRDLLESDGACE